MKKLKTKVFFTIFGLMTGALTIAVAASIIGDYIHTQEMLSHGMELLFKGDPKYLPPDISLFNIPLALISPESNFLTDDIVQGFYVKTSNTLIIFFVFVAVFFFISKLLTE